MLRTIFTIGLFALLGLFALKIVFGVMAGLFGVFFLLLGVAIKIAIVGGAVYLVIRIVSPSTAKQLRQKFSGSTVV
jgi:hypothetical protein